MIGVGLKKLGHTPVPNLPSSYHPELEAKPGKLVIRRHKPDILFISLSIVSLFKTSDNDII